MDTATAVPGLKITRVPLDSLHLDPANARQHPERNLETIRGSLQRFGQAEPLVVHKATRRVIGGNGRLVAMRELGWPECDVVEIEADEVTATALGIALNRTAELASWDLPALGALLESLQAEGAHRASPHSVGPSPYACDEKDATCALLRGRSSTSPRDAHDHKWRNRLARFAPVEAQCVGRDTAQLEARR